MTEPTIDEMLAWFDSATSPYWVHWQSFEELSKHERDSNVSHEQQCHQAIRAILEQHRKSDFFLNDVIADSKSAERKQMQLDAVRAFVERVGKRADAHASMGLFAEGMRAYETAMQRELAAIERENERTND